MRHYEIVFLVHPDQSDQVPGMVERYNSLIIRGQGLVHRTEDWGRRQLAFPIAKIHKAHYVMLNIEVNTDTLEELESSFRFNDAVIRHMVIGRKSAVTGDSKMLQDRLAEQEREREREHQDTKDQHSSSSEDDVTDAGDPVAESKDDGETGLEDVDELPDNDKDSDIADSQEELS